MLVLAVAICAMYINANAHLVGPITIKEDGKSVTRYVVSTGNNVKLNGSSIILPHNSGIQIAMNASDKYSPYIFMEYKLKNKTLSFTADLSNVGCSCNAAFYLVSMPGIGKNGEPHSGGQGDYYCDANDGNSDFCWELDVMEANRYVTQATPHQCNEPPGGYISSCDRSGCATNAYNVDSKGMCPNDSCKINTMQPFTQSMNFGTTIHVTLTQNNNKFEFDACNNAKYVQSMDIALHYGMTVVMSHWGSSYNEMAWLDGKTGCKGACDGSGQAIFGDIEIA